MNPKIQKQILEGFLKVLKYFLDLFKAQLGVSEHATAEFRLVALPTVGSNYSYQLRVKVKENFWETRRMSIGPLGAESGSKSRCYYVIYDDHIVVKITPTPITSFKAYIQSIRADKLIVDQVAPRKCIVPGISVILKLLNPFPDADQMNHWQIEELYVKWLMKNPQYLRYLQIEKSFVYFMDLSMFYILGDIVSNMHDKMDAIIYDEITKNPTVLWDEYAFQGRYGVEQGSVCYNVLDVYEKFEDKARTLQVQSGVGSPALLYKTQQWFLVHLAGGRIPTGQRDLPDDFIEELNELLKELMTEFNESVVAYRAFIGDVVGKISFTRNRPVMASLIANFLELLSWLGNTQVAMRDLKPDNLLVIGDRNKYPFFLRKSEDFKLGLIDVETSVIYATGETGAIKQPQLGGTPFYATPSHLFKNEYLAMTYDDVGFILHLQDWYATIVMIYRVVTGDHLFSQTARLLPAMKQKIQGAVVKQNQVADIIKDVNRLFWQSAVSELKDKMSLNEQKLKSVMVPINEKGNIMMRKFMHKVESNITDSMRKLVASQKFYSSDAQREQLLKASYNAVSQMKSKWETVGEGSKLNAQERTDLLKFLAALLKLKLQIEQQEWIVSELTKPNARLNAFVLMTILFNTVMKFMYKDEWGSFPPLPKKKMHGAPVGDDSVYGVTLL